MPKITSFQTTLSSGEVDPSLRSQNDLKAYVNGALRVRDCVRRSTGGAERRNGFLDTGPLNDEGRLEGFEFSNDQRYLVSFRVGAADFYDLNGVQLATLAGPWTADQLDEITVSQQGDYMIVAHQAWMTRMIKRTGPTSFTIALFAFQLSLDSRRLYAPFYKFVDPSVTMTPSGSTGSINLTCSIPFFTTAYIGRRIRIYDIDILITAITSTTIAVGTVQGELKGRLDIDPFKTTKGSTQVEVLHLFHGLLTGQVIGFSGGNRVAKIPASYFTGSFAVTVIDDIRYTIELGAMSYPVREDLNQDGTDETTTYTSAHDSEDGGGSNVMFTVAGAATRTWLEEAISDVRGFPGGSSFHQGRSWLCGTTSQPDGTFGSNALNPFRYEVGKGFDGDSVQLGAGSEDASRVRHMISNGDLQLFTATQESIFLTRAGEAITPTNARIRSQSDAGIGNVQPIRLDGATLFVQENGLTVSELVYSTEGGGYRANPISMLAGHLVRKPVSATSSAGLTNRAEKFAYFANEDGTIGVYHSMRAENISGWGLWTLGAGTVRSVCAIGSFLFASVFVRGTWRLYRLGDDALDLLDGMVRHVAVSGQSTWTLDARVRNRDCAVVSELGYHGIYSIPASGIIDIGVAVTTLSVGDPFFALIETLPPRIALPSGEETGNITRMVKSVVEFDDTLNAIVDGRLVGTRGASADVDAPPVPVSGPVETRHLGFGRNQTLTITQDAPLSMRVLGILTEVKV